MPRYTRGFIEISWIHFNLGLIAPYSRDNGIPPSATALPPFKTIIICVPENSNINIYAEIE